ncbi:hypothetical protein DFH09DRAFT_1136324 [Mycena vulgaris]|nr:hypothetical protein DFH09DRAFT_1136324 [Mycena vulgaris]
MARTSTNLPGVSGIFVRPGDVYSRHLSSALANHRSQPDRMPIWLRPSWRRAPGPPSASSLEALFLWEHTDALQTFINRSSCRLTQLIMMCRQDTTTIPAVLRFIPTLTHLTLELARPEGIDFLFEDMTLSDSPADLCTNLTSFSFGGRGAQLISDD